MPFAAHPDIIAKVGAVILRQDGAQEWLVFIVRPKPKKSGEKAKFVLPRGSRQYATATGEWRDARDQQTAQQFADSLEPLERTLAREMEEEAGLPQHFLAQDSAMIGKLGARIFRSATKGHYPVFWYVLKPNEAALEAMDHAIPPDAEEWCWKTPADIKGLAKAGDFSKGYVPVITEALRVGS